MTFFCADVSGARSTVTATVCETCGVARVAMVTETVTIWRRVVTIVLCMRCWLKEYGA